MVKKFYDYETESGNKLMFPRMHFRNMNNVKALIEFPFNLTIPRGLYTEPYDTYSYKNTDILVIGGDAHCHIKGELGKYKEGIAFYCEDADKKEIIKQIKKVV